MKKNKRAPLLPLTYNLLPDFIFCYANYLRILSYETNVRHIALIYLTHVEMTNIHLLHAGEGNMKIYSPKSIIFPEGNARGECDTRG